MIVPVGVVLGLSAILFGIGVFGFLARRNIILMLVSVEIMLNAVNLSLVGFSRHLEDSRGQILALFVIAVAAAEAGVGLGLVIALNVITFSAIGDCAHKNGLERPKVVPRIILRRLLRQIVTERWKVKDAGCEMANAFALLMRALISGG